VRKTAHQSRQNNGQHLVRIHGEQVAAAVIRSDKAVSVRLLRGGLDSEAARSICGAAHHFTRMPRSLHNRRRVSADKSNQIN